MAVVRRVYLARPAGPIPGKIPWFAMDTITVPTENSTFGPVAEIKQVSVAADEDVSAINALLADGWKLLHVGHTQQHTVYVLGKPTPASKRRTGFTTSI